MVPSTHHARHCTGGVTQKVHDTGGDALSQRAGQRVWMHKEHLAPGGRAVTTHCSQSPMQFVHLLRCLIASRQHSASFGLTQMDKVLSPVRLRRLTKPGHGYGKSHMHSPSGQGEIRRIGAWSGGPLTNPSLAVSWQRVKDGEC